MIFDSDGTTTIVLQEKATLKTFIENLVNGYDKIKNDHIILNLFSFSKLSESDILEFLEISSKHRAAKKSFVLVTAAISFEDVPEQICVVPTIQEAKDIIEMEEIERDLGL
ncbi:ribonuclease Z [Cellulophaga sp. HaHaR_3_176]|uniref:ribonuclease Z n=1 Tax=Cellulophaga sp. HaHaR_3_176 TaxID=1942464 RepID=UPI001C1F6F39|nr:ribonuclease Z [Cellulophaga sp. HaHaR_3_176]QWX84708.1 ribonuclease Z [Cellulophaga sp. HaHaR_3_176]